MALIMEHQQFLCPFVFAALLDFPAKTCGPLRGRRRLAERTPSVAEYYHERLVLLHRSGSCKKDDNGALTSVGSMWSVLKRDCVVVIICQPVFQASTNHL